MKSKLILFVLALFSAGAAVAQPTLTAVTSNPVTGDMFFKFPALNVGPGNAGANVTWDFTSIMVTPTDTSVLTFDTSANNHLYYYPCDSFHHCAALSGITNVDSLTTKYFYSFGPSAAKSQTWYYYVSDGQKLAVAAINEGTDSATRTDSTFYSNPEDLLRYPMTYTNTFLDTFEAKLMLNTTQTAKDTMRILGTQHAVADGYGLLKLPIGTYTNVLRVHRAQTVMVIDTNLSVTAFDTVTFTVDDYRWYNTLQRQPLMVMTIRTLGTLHDTTTYFTSLPVVAAITDVHGAISGVLLSPNPAKSNFNLSLTLASAQHVAVALTDVAGRTLKSWDNGKLSAGEHHANYETGALPAGLYFVRIQTSVGTVVKPLQLQ